VSPLKKNRVQIPIGPIHPALKEPIQIEVEIKGEHVENVSITLGHIHRGIEWIGLRRNPVQTLALAERVCGICNIVHPLAFCTAIENAAKIKVPERAEYLRVIYAELERIHSHLLFLGVAAHELGFDSILHYTWLAREKVLDVIEYLTGNRITKAILMIGGVRRDITEKQVPKLREALEYYEKVYKKLCDMFLDDPTINARTRDIGVLTKKLALQLCAVGPTARASGIKKDIRQDFPYAAYADLNVEAITPDILLNEVRGDTFDRVVVRVLEIKQSLELIDRCLKDMPEGPMLYEPMLQKLLVMLKQVAGEGVALIEAPRGELIHYIRMEKSEKPVAWKIRAPTYANLNTIVPMLEGCELADVPIVVASIDPCISCANRAIIADKNAVLDQEKLHALSVNKTRALLKGDSK
jgi:membrane-bound hydrogenase subunit alpha